MKLNITTLTLALAFLVSTSSFAKEAKTTICGVTMPLQNAAQTERHTSTAEAIDNFRDEGCSNVLVCLIDNGLAVVCHNQNYQSMALIWSLEQ